MRDRPAIWAGLAIFLTLFSYPVWRNAAARADTRAPVLTPAKGRQCVAPVEYMRTSHMKYLLSMRERVVREGDRAELRSLTGTCLEQCHGSKTGFCDQCHSYAAVRPDCWNCHQDAPAGFTVRAAR